jgi:citrate lyase subunit beta/citryl-CoA lyase
MPGANARALAKAATLPADVLILDLEDAVAPQAKAEARAQVCEFVRAGRGGGREVVIRINALATPWGADDLRAAAAAGVDAILLPKVSGAADLADAEHRLEGGAKEHRPQLWAMVETPAGVLNCAAIAAAAPGCLAALVAGCNDLAKEMRVAPDPGRSGLTWALSTIVTAARANGIAALDGVFNDLADAAAFAAECRQGRCFGFDGKTLIHPTQIDTANAVFSPTAAEVGRARAIIDAFAQPGNAASGVLRVNGEMVERLHLEEARSLLAFSEAIARAG